jgi:hypothetical protein
MSQEPKQETEARDKGQESGRPPIDFVAVAREMFILTMGLLIGFVWTMLASGSGDFEIYNMFIGLVIIMFVLVRYLYLAKYKSRDSDKDGLIKQFLIEVVVLVPSIMLGLLWWLWYDADRREAVHLVMLMVVVVYGLFRLVLAISQRPEA